jgi:hypothetical protein
MFEQTILLTLLLAPVLAYVAVALVFSVYELIHKDPTSGTPYVNANYRNGH